MNFGLRPSTKGHLPAAAAAVNYFILFPSDKYIPRPSMCQAAGTWPDAGGSDRFQEDTGLALRRLSLAAPKGSWQAGGYYA